VKKIRKNYTNFTIEAGVLPNTSIETNPNHWSVGQNQSIIEVK
jgi:hypothetical protein